MLQATAAASLQRRADALRPLEQARCLRRVEDAAVRRARELDALGYPAKAAVYWDLSRTAYQVLGAVEVENRQAPEKPLTDDAMQAIVARARALGLERGEPAPSC